eukprot:5057728-Pyramimonas_sp.AAC.1
MLAAGGETALSKRCPSGGGSQMRKMLLMLRPNSWPLWMPPPMHAHADAAAACSGAGGGAWDAARRARSL